MARYYLEFLYPNMREGDYKIIGPADRRFNCLSLANNDRTRWWHSSARGLMWHSYWPAMLPRNGRVGTITLLFKRQGYKPCDSAEYEPGFTKVAIYSDGLQDSYTHVALMLEGGTWRSKLGKSEEIEHKNLNCLEGPYPSYGFVAIVLKRPINPIESH